MQDENIESSGELFKHSDMKLLPDLSNNIKCGNSLIGSDFYDDKNDLFDKESLRSINAFDWDKEFQEIFEKTKKNVEAFHVTWVTHNSRASERMKEHKVKTGEPVYLSEEDEITATETIQNIIKEDDLKCLAYNICRDHVHILLVCEKDDLANIVQKMKSMSARSVNIAKGITIETRETVTNKGACSLVGDSDSIAVSSEIPTPTDRGETQNHLWAQKFDIRTIADDPKLTNTINYINNNRIKHDLPDNKGLQPIIAKMLTSIDKAFDQFEQGGFDCVIGNPPWGAELTEQISSFLIKRNSLLKIKNKDSYFYFILKSITQLKKMGKLGMIIPNTWLLINNAASFRDYLLNFNILEIIDHGDGVFKDAIVESSTIIFENKKTTNYNCQVKRIKKGKIILNQIVDVNLWKNDDLKRIVLEKTADFIGLMEKINKVSQKFVINCEIIFGIKPYQIGHGTPPQTKEMLEKRIYHSDVKIDDTWKPLLTGSDINRYRIIFPKNQFIKYGKWLMYPSNEEKILNEKILLRRTSDKIRASFDNEKYYPQNSIFIITSKSFNYKYLLGILNSSLLNYIYIKTCPQQGKIFAEIKPSIIKELPIRIINTSNKNELSFHDSLVSLVDQMLQAQKDFYSAKSDLDKTLHKKQIDIIDKKIDALVYELYGLTEEEIRIVEGE